MLLMLPKKLYYSISEVCTLTELEPHVLRYWENEFPLLHPKKNRAGNRAYREKDIEIIKFIKHLLYEEKFTIPGAKKKITEGKIPIEPAIDNVLPLTLSQTEVTDSGSIEEIKRELKEILNLLTK